MLLVTIQREKKDWNVQKRNEMERKKNAPHTLNGMGATMTMKLTLMQRHEINTQTYFRWFAVFLFLLPHTQNISATILVPHGNDNSF